MKLFSSILVSSLLLYAIVACASPTALQSPANVLLEPSEVKLKTLATIYTGFPALNQDLKLSPTHGGVMVRTHLDATAQQAFPLPEGVVAAKEAHQNKDGSIVRIYVMKKVKNYDPAIPVPKTKIISMGLSKHHLPMQQSASEILLPQLG